MALRHLLPVLLVLSTTATQAQTVPDCGVQSFSATYTLINETRAGGATYPSSESGRIVATLQNGRPQVYIDRVVNGLPEMQLWYIEGRCYRWYPFTRYGQEIAAHSFDNAKTGWGRIWRPLIVSLFPAELDRAFGVKAAGSQDRDGVSLDAFAFETVDRQALMASRTSGSRLEFWGYPPSLTCFVTPSPAPSGFPARRIVGWDAEYTARSGRITKKTAVSLAFGTVGSMTVPVSIEYTSTMPQYGQWNRRIRVQLTDVHVNEPVATSASPLPAADVTLLLPPETPAPSEYRTTHPFGTEIKRADYLFGTHSRSQAIAQVDQLLESLPTVPSAPLMAHTARLLVWADRRSDAEGLFSRTLTSVRAEVSAGTRPPTDLAAYLHERAFFLSRSHGGKARSTKRRLAATQAGDFLMAEASQVTNPAAKARIIGSAARQYMAADNESRARSVIQSELSTTSSAVANQWLTACMQLIDRDAARDAVYDAIKAKRKLLRNTRDALKRYADSGVPDDDPRVVALKTQLASLLAQP